MNSSNSIALAEKAMANEFNHTEHVYIDICNDLVAGTLLSQIIYWFKPKPDGKSKIRVKHDGKWWLAKSREDWWDEIRITPRQFDYAIKSLVKLGFVEKRVFKFDNVPMVHVRPIADTINRATEKWIMNYASKVEQSAKSTERTKGENSYVSDEKEPTNNENSPFLTNCQNGFLQNVKMDFDKSVKSITENTNIEYNTEYQSREHSNTFSKDNNSYMFSRGKVEETSNVRSDAKIKNVDLYNEIEVSKAFVQTFDHWNLNPEMRAYKAPMFFLTTFANAYKEHRGHKHKKLSVDKMRLYVEKINDFTPKKFNHDKMEYEDVCHTFSILDYDEAEIRQMVEDYFTYPFDDCDYSIHHFMSDSVLASRFWVLENRRSEIAV